jgi:RHS repeat-associated protein
MVGTMEEERFVRLNHRDSETSLDPTHFRMYSSSVGRWMTPDPAGRRAANPRRPQSWNRYAYVLNNSVNFADQYGLCNWRQIGTGALQCIGGTAMIAGCLVEDASTVGLTTGFAVLCANFGASFFVQGTINIAGGVTNTNVSAANAALESMGTLPGIYVTALSGGNLGAGSAASTLVGLTGDIYDVATEGGPLSYGGTAIDLGETGLELEDENSDSNPFGYGWADTATASGYFPAWLMC